MKRYIQCSTISFGVIVLLCLLGGAASVWSGSRLPAASQTVERLSVVEKARLEELIHLRQELSGQVWAGWEALDVPLVVYNEAYAFLVGFAGSPPPGWKTAPRGQERGTDWEPVTGESVGGLPYYRQALSPGKPTPENFTVLVGEQWAASMQTWEYSEIAFYQGFRKELPVLIQPVFPYRLAWKFLLGETEVYLGGLAHETFHAFQGSSVPQRLAAAEYAAPLEERYPWQDEASERLWKEELRLLRRAAKAGTDAEAAELAAQFLAQRAARRSSTGLGSKMVEYERQREWLEGLAKYAELALIRKAAESQSYTSMPELAADQGFSRYSSSLRFFDQQLDEIGRMTNHRSEIRFYYCGMGQAVLLDRLLPGWKEQAFDEGVWLEDLLAQALQ